MILGLEIYYFLWVEWEFSFGEGFYDYFILKF